MSLGAPLYYLARHGRCWENATGLELVNDLLPHFDCVAFCNLNPATDTWSYSCSVAHLRCSFARERPEEHLNTVLTAANAFGFEQPQTGHGSCGAHDWLWLAAAPFGCTPADNHWQCHRKSGACTPLGLLGAVDFLDAGRGRQTRTFR